MNYDLIERLYDMIHQTPDMEGNSTFIKYMWLYATAVKLEAKNAMREVFEKRNGRS